jgi:hypothetical protein
MPVVVAHKIRRIAGIRRKGAAMVVVLPQFQFETMMRMRVDRHTVHGAERCGRIDAHFAKESYDYVRCDEVVMFFYRKRTAR